MLVHDQSIAAGMASTNVAPQSVAAANVALPRFRVAEPTTKAITLLWVDDSRLLLSLYQSVFQNFGFEVLAVSSPNEALQYLASYGADVAILDYDMPEMDGGTLAFLIKHRCPMMPVILHSGNTSIPQTVRHWVDAICAKGAPREELLATIERLSHKAGGDNNRPRSFAPSSSH